MSREFLGENESVFVPTPKVLDHDQGDTLSTAVVEVGPVFGHFACIDGGGGTVGRLNNDGFLRGRRDADVECNAMTSSSSCRRQKAQYAAQRRLL